MGDHIPLWLKRLGKRVWVRALLFSLGAVATALLAGFVGPYLPYDPSLTLAAGSVGRILDILAASMLAVTIFSLSITVSAYSSATSNVTPRATRLLREDSVAQNTLATFVGSFLFSIVGIIGLSAGVYSDKGRIILFAATLIVLVIITAMLLRWIEQIGRFGRVSDTIHRIESAASRAAKGWGERPRLGAANAIAIPGTAGPIYPADTGYIGEIDADALAGVAERHRIVIHLAVLPGAFVHPTRPLAYADPAAEDELSCQIANCFSISPERSFDQDLRFGLIVLSEVASRALSPAVNDPGTAIEVIGAGVRVLLRYGRESDERVVPVHPRLHAPDLQLADLFDDLFNAIARDGASMIEVQLRLQAALEALSRAHPDRFDAAARAHAGYALDRARLNLDHDHDRNRLERASAWAL